MEKSYRAFLKLWPNLNDWYCVFIIDVVLIDGVKKSDEQQRRNSYIFLFSHFQGKKKKKPEKWRGYQGTKSVQ